MKVFSFLTILGTLLLSSCNSKQTERLFRVNSGIDYYTITENLEPPIVGKEVLSLVTQEELLSAYRHTIQPMDSLFANENFSLKVFYLTISGEEGYSEISLRTFNNQGKLIDNFTFDSFGSNSEAFDCSTVISKDLIIRKQCDSNISNWKINSLGIFEPMEL